MFKWIGISAALILTADAARNRRGQNIEGNTIDMLVGEKTEIDTTKRANVIMIDKIRRSGMMFDENSLGKRQTWPEGKINWCHAPDISLYTLNAFVLALKHIEEAVPGCFTFKQIENDGMQAKEGKCQDYPEKSSIYLRSDQKGCFSTKGMITQQEGTFKVQTINLEDNVCDFVGIATHELMHTLGLEHEHTRSDRDNFIKINYSNLKRHYAPQFQVDKRTIRDISYDYLSIMHYSADSGAIDPSRPTIIPINCSGTCPKLGQRRGLSERDGRLLASTYSCKAVSTWTDTFKCIDQPFGSSSEEPLDCALYVEQGKCSEDPSPCCGCGNDGGWDTRLYIPKVQKECKNKKPYFCSEIGPAFCESTYVKINCNKMCGTCVAEETEQTADEESISSFNSSSDDEIDIVVHQRPIVIIDDVHDEVDNDLLEEPTNDYNYKEFSMNQCDEEEEDCDDY